MQSNLLAAPLAPVEDRGAPIASFPRSVSLGNWPFVVFLLVLDAALSYGAIAVGEPGVARIIAPAVLAPAVLVLAVQLLGEWLGPWALDAISQNGVTLRRLTTRRFVPWSRITAVQRLLVLVRAVEVTHWLVTLEGEPRQLRVTPQEQGAKTAELIATRAGLTIS